jgi:hypothetical protein
MARKAVFCTVPHATQASHITDRLKFAHISGDAISVLLPAAVVTEAGGGVFEWLAGIDASGIPEIGPFIAAGPILVVLSNIETAAESTSVTGALMALGLPEFMARNYEDKVKTGNILLSVHAEHSGEIVHAERIFMEAEAGDVCAVGKISGADSSGEREPASFEFARAASRS